MILGGSISRTAARRVCGHHPGKLAFALSLLSTFLTPLSLPLASTNCIQFTGEGEREQHQATAMAARIYVGNLPMDIRERDVEEMFARYGRVTGVDLKTPAR